MHDSIRPSRSRIVGRLLHRSLLSLRYYTPLLAACLYARFESIASRFEIVRTHDRADAMHNAMLATNLVSLERGLHSGRKGSGEKQTKHEVLRSWAQRPFRAASRLGMH